MTVTRSVVELNALVHVSLTVVAAFAFTIIAFCS